MVFSFRGVIQPHRCLDRCPIVVEVIIVLIVVAIFVRQITVLIFKKMFMQ